MSWLVSVLEFVIFVVFLLAIAPWVILGMEIYSSWTEDVAKRMRTRHRARRMRREAEEADRMSHPERRIR